MQRAKSILAVLMAIPLAGCLLRGKPATPSPASPVKPAANSPVVEPPKPPALSIPQTQAQLPAPQPLPEGALAATEPAEEEPPARLAPPVKPPTRRPVSRPGPAPVETSPGPAAPVEPDRPPVQELVPAEKQNQLREEAKASRLESQQIVARVQNGRITPKQRDSIGRIQTFLKQSESAELRGDLQAAKQLADKALVLAKELR